MNNFPLVSIIAVCYNQEQWVSQTLDSIASQTYPAIQLIVADDGSTDGSKRIINKWIKEKKPETIFINHEKNAGLTKNINSALPYVKGSYFQAFGCDDIMLPHKIASQVAVMETNKNAGIIYSDMLMINNSGESLKKSYYEQHIYKQPKSGWLYKDLIERFIIAAPTALIKRNVLEKLGGYNELLDYEDHDFFLRAAKSFEFIYDPRKTVEYRISEQSMTSTNTSAKFFKNSFLLFLSNFDYDENYRKLFVSKLLFYAKNLYTLKFRLCGIYCARAFFKTKKIVFLKYSVAGIPFYFTNKKTQK